MFVGRFPHALLPFFVKDLDGAYSRTHTNMNECVVGNSKQKALTGSVPFGERAVRRPLPCE
jgi:hypothetical protein